jgi:hypothetical protein
MMEHLQDESDGSTDPRRQRLPPDVEGLASVEGDVVQVSEELWAVHGVWPYDGEVILAEFSSFSAARLVIRGPAEADTPPESG